MICEEYEDFDSEEMDDETFEEFLEFAGLDTPRLISDKDIPIIENRIDFLKSKKRINPWVIVFGVATGILYFSGFNAQWWGWLIGVFACGTVISWVGGYLTEFCAYNEKISKLEHWISWKKYNDDFPED